MTAAEGTLTVVHAGALTTVQDLGRPGYAHLGVPHSGAVDLPSLRLANRLVGNPQDTAGLETTATGCVLRVAGRGHYVAVTGAQASVRVGDREATMNTACYVPAGASVTIGPATTGVRGYVAVAGGITVEPVLGSRSTDLLSGLGPAVLHDGDVLPLDVPAAIPPPVGVAPVAPVAAEPVLRLMPGPRVEWFTAAA